MGPARVRIWYRSEGDEVLACDSSEMSDASAVAFRERIMKGDHDVIGAEVFTGPGPTTPPGIRKYRLVTKPVPPTRARDGGIEITCPECEGPTWVMAPAPANPTCIACRIVVLVDGATAEYGR